MRYPFLKYLTSLLLLLNFFAVSIAQDVPPRPADKDLVFDFANFLSKNEAKELNTTLENFALETSNQILFLSVSSLNDLQPYEFAERVLSTWGVGQKDLNNGVVILVKPKTDDSRGEVFIATGYGLEGAIPDATAKMIVENEMIPEFKKGNNFQGVMNATQTLMALAKGEINSGEYQSRSSKKATWFPVFIFFLIMFFIFFGKAAQAKQYAGANNMAFWAAFWLLTSSSRNHGGSWDGFSGGGGFGGGGFGGGGGGFGGFGGGMGGGGGAGGSW
jgi:uncharacterized protein